MDKKRLEISGAELVTLAGSLAICFAKNYEKEDLRKLRSFFSTISLNIGIIESDGLNRNTNKK